MIICAYFIIRILMKAFRFIEDKQEPQVEPMPTKPRSEPFVYFRADSVYYAWGTISHTLFITRTNELMYGNTILHDITATNKHLAIVNQFLHESKHGYAQFEPIDEANYFHIFRVVANRTANAFNPIHRNQFETE